MTYSMTIGGVLAPTLADFQVINPANEAEAGRAPNCTPVQLDKAVAEARAAFAAWRDLGWEGRRRRILAFARALAGDVEVLAPLLTAEQGKPLAEARGELLKAVDWVEALAALDLPPTANPAPPDVRSETHHVPIGVVAALAPWNFPVALAMWKVAPALIAGNAVVLKPSPLTPLTTLAVGEIANRVLPPGVLNVVSGDDSLGPRLTSHPGIDKVSFTGSTRTGRSVMAAGASSLKRMTLELGGNDAAIVMPDVDVDAVAQPLFWSAFRNAGQLCIAAKRLYIHNDIYDRLAEAMSAIAREVRVGDGMKPGIQLGPVQNGRQHLRLLRLLAAERECGARFLAGGSPLGGPGFFLPPTLIDNPPEDAAIVAEEQFGPIAPLIRVSSAEDALARANASSYGLGASVWTADLDLAANLASRLEAGTVWINEPPSASPMGPFGGHKQSGIGVENGRPGLAEYTLTRTVVTRL